MSDRELKFYIDGIQVTEPSNWDKIKIKIDGDTTFNGLFVNYIDKLTLVGTAYSYILSKIDAYGYCGVLSFEVQDYTNGSKNNDGLNYEGRIDLSDVKINRTNCTAIISVEDKTYGGTLKKKKDIEYNLQATEDFNFTMLGITKKGLWVEQILSQLVDVITDGNLTFISDFFQTNEYTPYINEIHFHSLGGGETNSVTWVDFYGVTQNWTSGVGDSALTQANDFFDTYLQTSVAAIGLPYGGENIMDGVFINQSVGVVSSTDVYVKVYAVHNPEIESTGNITYNSTSTYLDGGYNVAHTSGNTMNGTSQVITVSLGKIYSELKKVYDLQCSLYTLNGVNYFRIEPKQYYIDSANNALNGDELNNIDNIDETIADELLFNSFNYSQGHSLSSSPGWITNIHLMQMKSVWDFDNCGIKAYDASLDYGYGIGALQNYTSMNDQDIFSFEADRATNNIINIFSLEKSPISNLHRTVLVSISALHPVMVKRRLQTVYAYPSLSYGRPNVTWVTTTFTNNNGGAIKKLHVFEYYLSCEQIKLLVDNPSGAIDFYDIDERKYKGYLKSLDYDTLSGKTKFELYSA